MPDSIDFENEQEQIKQAKSKVYKLLARREYSEQEISHKLAQVNYSDFIIKKVLTDFQVNNQQSDYRVAIMLLTHGYKSGFGPNKIKLNMQSKGIDSQLINEVFASIEYQDTNSDCNKANNFLVQLSKQQKIDKLKNLIIESKEIKDDFSYINWFGLALEAAKKKFGRELASLNNKVNNDWQFKGKIQRFLYNKGFEQEHINYVISCFS